MKLAQTLIWLNAVFFAVYGVLFVFAPIAISHLVVDASPASPSALIDMRATYGGMSIAVGLLFAFLVQKKSTIRIGMIGVIMMMSCMAAGRLVGMIVDGDPNVVMYVYLILEIGMASLSMYALKQLPNHASQAGADNIDPE